MVIYNLLIAYKSNRPVIFLEIRSAAQFSILWMINFQWLSALELWIEQYIFALWMTGLIKVVEVIQLIINTSWKKHKN